MAQADFKLVVGADTEEARRELNAIGAAADRVRQARSDASGEGGVASRGGSVQGGAPGSDPGRAADDFGKRAGDAAGRMIGKAVAGFVTHELARTVFDSMRHEGADNTNVDRAESVFGGATRYGTAGYMLGGKWGAVIGALAGAVSGAAGQATRERRAREGADLAIRNADYRRDVTGGANMSDRAFREELSMEGSWKKRIALIQARIDQIEGRPAGEAPEGENQDRDEKAEPATARGAEGANEDRDEKAEPGAARGAEGENQGGDEKAEPGTARGADSEDQGGDEKAEPGAARGAEGANEDRDEKAEPGAARGAEGHDRSGAEGAGRAEEAESTVAKLTRKLQGITPGTAFYNSTAANLELQKERVADLKNAMFEEALPWRPRGIEAGEVTDSFAKRGIEIGAQADVASVSDRMLDELRAIRQEIHDVASKGAGDFYTVDAMNRFMGVDRIAYGGN